MTLILKFDLDMAKMYLHTKNDISMWRGSKVIAWTDEHTNKQTNRHKQTHTHTHTHMTENITYPHTPVVKNKELADDINQLRTLKVW